MAKRSGGTSSKNAPKRPHRSRDVEYPGRPPKPWGLYLLILVLAGGYVFLRFLADPVLLRATTMSASQLGFVQSGQFSRYYAAGESGLAQFRALLSGFSPINRANAIEYLEPCAASAEAQAIAKDALQDESLMVRLATLRLLHHWGQPQWNEALAKIATNGHPAEQILAKSILLRVGGAEGIALAKKIIAQPVPKDENERRKYLVWYQQASETLLQTKEREAILPALLARAQTGLSGEAGSTSGAGILTPMDPLDAQARIDAINLIGQSGVTTDEVSSLLESLYKEPPRAYLRGVAERAILNLGLTFPDLEKYLQMKKKREINRILLEIERIVAGQKTPGASSGASGPTAAPSAPPPALDTPDSDESNPFGSNLDEL